MTDKAIEIQPDTANIRINVGRHGVWLFLKASNGQEAGINVPHLAESGGIIASAIRHWCIDREDQARSIASLERK